MATEARLTLRFWLDTLARSLHCSFTSSVLLAIALGRGGRFALPTSIPFFKGWQHVPQCRGASLMRMFLFPRSRDFGEAALMQNRQEHRFLADPFKKSIFGQASLLSAGLGSRAVPTIQ